MIASPFDSAVFRGLFADPDVAAALGDTAFVSAMIQVEAALARAQAEIGAIPRDDGLALAAALDQAQLAAQLAPEALADGVRRSAVPVPALVAALRSELPDRLGQWLHWGATSQDVVDTAALLTQRNAMRVIEARLRTIAVRLATLAETHRDTAMLGRTWGQYAAPVSFGLVAANWLSPLVTLATRRAEMRPRVFTLQLGGAVGDMSAMGPDALAVRDRMAASLDLSTAPPWHADRLRLAELGAWQVDLAATFGKMGADLVLYVQSEVGEIRLDQSGGSSTMPQKQNPVAPSAMVALARDAIGRQSSLLHATLHGQQRDGQAWLIEWLALAPLTQAAAGAARLAEETVVGMTPMVERMRANLDAAGAAPLAEAVSFALAAHMPRADAQALVKAAAAEVGGGDLIGAIRARTDAPVDWSAAADPANDLGQANALIDEILAKAADAGLRPETNRSEA